MALLSEAPSLSIQLLWPGFKNSLREKLYQFCGNGAFSSPSTCGSLALSGPPNWPSPTPPPTQPAKLANVLIEHILSHTFSNGDDRPHHSHTGMQPPDYYDLA